MEEIANNLEEKFFTLNFYDESFYLSSIEKILPDRYSELEENIYSLQSQMLLAFDRNLYKEFHLLNIPKVKHRNYSKRLDEFFKKFSLQTPKHQI